MKKHPDDEDIQYQGLSCLFCIVKNIVDKEMVMNFEATKNIVDSALNVMFCHKDEPTLIKTACLVILTLRKRNIKFAYERYKQVHDYFVQKYELENHERYQIANNCLSKLMRQLQRQRRVH